MNPLTPKESDVCQVIAAGLTDAEGAIKLGMNLSTFRTYKRRSFRKLKVGRRGEIMALMSPALTTT